MYVIESKGGAIVCMLLSLFFLGTWPAIIASLERRGRLPQHTYLDYTITNLLAAVLIALIFGQLGDSVAGVPNFITQLYQDNWPSVLFAMAGGVALSIGNLATQYAWPLVGLSVVEVVCSCITVTVGTSMNYFLDGRINRAEVLFPGVGCFLIAVFLGAAVHKSNAADNKVKLRSLPSDYEEEEWIRKPLKVVFGMLLDVILTSVTRRRMMMRQSHFDRNKDPLASDGKSANKVGSMDIEKVSDTSKAEFGTAKFLVQLEKKRSIKVFGRNIWIGMGITVFAGLCFSLFSPLFNLATNDQFHLLKKAVPHLVVYTAFFYFSVSCFVVAIILNVIFLYYPVLDAPKSSFKAYLSDWNGRGWALLAGLLCGFGNGLQFMGGQAAGYAAADAVQALPLVSTFWAVLIFGEYRKSSKRTYILLISMLSMFIIAVGVLMASSGHRKS